MSEPTIIDDNMGIWIVEIPVYCQTRGHLVLCNEESIGYVEPIGPDDYLASVAARGYTKSIRAYRKITQAARAVAHEALGSMVIEDYLPPDADETDWDMTLNRYIEFGPSFWAGR